MLKLTSFWHEGLFIVAILFAFLGVAFQVSNNTSIASTSVVCDANTNFGSPAFGEQLSGVVPISFNVPPLLNGYVVSVQAVDFFTNNTFISHATADTVSSSWHSQWDTHLQPDGPTEVTAKVYDQQNTLLCVSAPQSVVIQNSTTSGSNDPSAVTGTLKIRLISPTSTTYTGVTNYPTTFEVAAFFNDGVTTTQVNQDTLFEWILGDTGTGVLTSLPNGAKVSYTAGPVAGHSILTVKAQYVGYVATKQFDIYIESSANSSFPGITDPTVVTQPVDTSTGSTTTNPDASTTTPIVATSPTNLSSSDPKLTACLIKTIGQVNYQDLIDKKKRLTFKNLRKASPCFATSRYILPANVAPIEPAKIETVKQDNRLVKVNNVEQADIDQVNDSGILLSGSSTPNSTVVLYVFSEPLVLTTTTDANGNWTYVLQDPLASGDHEVYVAVEDDSGEPVRSSAYSFTVAEAASLSNNPSGLSLRLNLSEADTNATVYYVSAVAAVMLSGLGVYMYIVKHKQKSFPVEANITPDNKQD